jgi:methionyl-tRNA formyltransferase
VADAARALDIPLEQPQSVNADEARERVAAERPEAVCICAFGALIKDPLLSDHEWFNVHPSLLPRWRGAAPIERAIDAGDELTGVSIMRPVAEMDAGPVCLGRDEPIGPDDDYGSLAGRLSEVAGELLVKALDEAPPFFEQPTEGVTLADKIAPEDRRLDPERWPAVAVWRRVRALNPHVGAYLELGGERLGVRRAAAVVDDVAPGVPVARNGRLLVGCREGAIELIEVLPAGGRPMPAGDYLRGRGKALVESG